jgi:hypothetical protein
MNPPEQQPCLASLGEIWLVLAETFRAVARGWLGRRQGVDVANS